MLSLIHSGLTYEPASTRGLAPVTRPSQLKRELQEPHGMQKRSRQSELHLKKESIFISSIFYQRTDFRDIHELQEAVATPAATCTNKTNKKDTRPTATPFASSQLPSFSAANMKVGHSKFFSNLNKTGQTQASEQADSEEASEETQDGAVEED
eukprot:jgi/Botrbrau1/4576/Bobra.60_2s0062.1